MGFPYLESVIGFTGGVYALYTYLDCRQLKVDPDTVWLRVASFAADRLPNRESPAWTARCCSPHTPNAHACCAPGDKEARSPEGARGKL